MSTQSFTKLAHLDTNALVGLFTFWEACDMADLPMESVKGWEDLRDRLVAPAYLDSAVFTSDDFGHIQSGLRCYRKMEAAKDDYDYLCCLVSRSELHHTILSAYASEELRRNRVPWTLAQKRPLRVYRQVLSDDDYSRIGSQIDTFFEVMSYDHGMDIKSVEEEAHDYYIEPERVWATAEKVWSLILMETMDAYVLAAAIESQSDCLITSDRMLQQTASNLRSAQGEWLSTSQDLRGALGKGTDFAFPAGVSPRSNDPLP